MATVAPASHLPRNSVALSGALKHAGYTPTACSCVFWRQALDNASVGIMAPTSYLDQPARRVFAS